MSTGDGEDLEQRLQRVEELLATEREYAEQWRRTAEERRVQLERLRQHPAIALAYSIAKVVLPPLRRVRVRVRRFAARARGLVHRLRFLPQQLDAPRRQRALERAVSDLPAAPALDTTVSVVILTRDGRSHLGELLPAIPRSGGRVEVIVVDNDSRLETAQWLDELDDVRIVRNDTNLSFSEANARGAAAAAGDVLCFLNDDVMPLAPGWLERMVRELVPDVAAVGAQLVYPRRRLGRARTRDLGVQHRGIGFRARVGGMPKAENLGHGEDPQVVDDAVGVGAVTAAAMVVRAEDFHRIGGFDPRYNYGAEDVDLCWRLRQDGRRIVVARGAVLYHQEGATRHRDEPSSLKERQEQNWDLLAKRFGPAINEAVARDRLTATGLLSPDRYRIAITVTRDDPGAGYGDWYTAHELGDQLTRLGWDVVYVERYRDAWYDIDEQVDAVLVLLDVFELPRVARPGLTTIAWIRNWAERWTSHPWFDDFDLVLASSPRIAEVVDELSRHKATVFPLATNPNRFTAVGRDRAGIVFTGNNWGHERGVEEFAQALPELRVLGKGWADTKALADQWEGHVDYVDLPSVYAGAVLVLDQAADHTRSDESLNSRVFDALAAGALPLTNQVAGAQEIFGDDLPTYTTSDELVELARHWMSRPEAAAARAADLRELVLERHTYEVRASQLRSLLLDRASRRSVVIATSVPDRRVASTWGDWHFAKALEVEIRARGHEVETITMPEWSALSTRRHDVFLHLKGRSVAPVAEGQFHVVWNISHPEELTPEECEAADLVLVASHTDFASEVRTRTSSPVEVLLQATDATRFRPREPDPRYEADVAFVGNSRFVRRPVVEDALAAGIDLHLYGANWEKFVDPGLVRATHVPNEELPVLYSSVSVLLNDHWDGMRRHGFASNRLFDALACGTVVVSDELQGLEKLFDGGVVTYRMPSELAKAIEELTGDPAGRRDRGRRGRAAVLAEHTFRHRAGQLLEAVERHAGVRT